MNEEFQKNQLALNEAQAKIKEKLELKGLRDQIAMRALQGVMANQPMAVPTDQDNIKHFCKIAYEYADAMLEAR